MSFDNFEEQNENKIFFYCIKSKAQIFNGNH